MKRVWILILCLLLVSVVALTALAANDTTFTIAADKTTYIALFDCEHNDPDLDGAGTVTDADAIYLLRHTLFPEDYPLYPKKD